MTKGGTHGFPNSFQFVVSNGEEKNETPKPVVTEPSPNAQHSGPRLATRQRAKKFPELLE